MRKIYNHIDLLGEQRLIDIYKHFVEAGTDPESLLDLVQTWAKVNFKTDQQAIDILDKQLGRDTTTGIKQAFDRQQRNQHRIIGTGHDLIKDLLGGQIVTINHYVMSKAAKLMD